MLHQRHQKKDLVYTELLARIGRLGGQESTLHTTVLPGIIGEELASQISYLWDKLIKLLPCRMVKIKWKIENNYTNMKQSDQRTVDLQDWEQIQGLKHLIINKLCLDIDGSFPGPQGALFLLNKENNKPPIKTLDTWLGKVPGW